MMVRPRHFTIEELFPPEVIEARGNKAWHLYDPEVLLGLDAIRDDFGAILVNNWHKGGDLKYRGFRPSDCRVGAKFSDHRFGRAADITPLESVLDTVYEAIRDGVYPQFNVVENIDATRGGNWIHVGRRNHDQTGVWVVDP